VEVCGRRRGERGGHLYPCFSPNSISSEDLLREMQNHQDSQTQHVENQLEKAMSLVGAAGRFIIVMKNL
jgi:hypothetical protein